MFVDASAIVAMAAGEADAPRFAAAVAKAARRLTSPIAVYESALAVARILPLPVDDARHAIAEFLAVAEIEVVAVPADAAALAIDAFARYGKGQGHPAQLNMGDCFAYACARHFDVPLLYKGDDFAQTDVRSA
jgi:ribonuclease VapC